MLTRRVAQLGVRFVRTSAPACSRENQGESGNSANQNNDNFPDVVTDPSSLPPWEIWRRRLELRKPILQRDEKPVQKVYHAPEFFHDFNEKLKGQRIPKITELGMTPEKWEHYNKA
ncbi:hypothetical protein WR25_04891 [Diploscapter pachys]|uniref:Uncharacterized protein n=1 Tax=Diploscapter pachys TaxID=2018661 RepID=A0A2A2L1U9_9BILA|nr:hypothetical protein WR25_04891 [Diploscapter pachys]